MQSADPVQDPLAAGTAPREWQAALELQFGSSPARTKLVRAKHHGPLRVQRPFYPEGDCCHLYVLHPPGGIAPGDSLQIDIALDSRSHALLATPSAGKVYTSDAQRSKQRQSVHAVVQSESCMEWLPQETIVFSGANVQLQTRFDLCGDAKLAGWDMICLGRRAHGEQFLQGDCVQLIEINRDGKPLMRERMHWQGDSEILRAPWGMAGQVVSGTLFATVDASRQQLDDWRAGLDSLGLPGEWGISQKPGMLLARFLGQSAAQGRRGFEYLWTCLRPLLNNRVACPPRIWNT